MRIVFMGTPDFAKESLEAVYNAGYEILGVVTNPDKPKGRTNWLLEVFQRNPYDSLMLYFAHYFRYKTVLNI